MYYHFAILLLFGPFMKVRLLNSSVFPPEICLQTANAITSLVSSYRQLYSLRRTPSFVPYIVLASSIMHLATADTTGVSSISASKHILQGTAHLLEMIPCHSFARRGSRVLRIMAQDLADAVNACLVKQPNLARDPSLSWLLNLSKDPDDGASADERDRDSLDELARHALSRAVTNFFSDEMDDGIGRHCGPMDNSIFCPFPRQVVPMVGFENQLARDGFCLI